MSEENNKKEARYDIYCKTCKYGSLVEVEDPCNECLSQPFNYDTHKPIKYKEADK